MWWEYNNGYGEPHMKGWLYVQGKWKWGANLTWHVVDLGSYYWLAYAWKWDGWRERWMHYMLIMLSSEDGVEPWMVHADPVTQLYDVLSSDGGEPYMMYSV